MLYILKLLYKYGNPLQPVSHLSQTIQGDHAANFSVIFLVFAGNFSGPALGLIQTPETGFDIFPVIQVPFVISEYPDFICYGAVKIKINGLALVFDVSMFNEKMVIAAVSQLTINVMGYKFAIIMTPFSIRMKCDKVCGCQVKFCV